MELRLALIVLCAFVGFASAGPRRALQSTASDDHLVHLLQQLCSDITDEVKHSVPAQFSELVHSLKSLPRASIARVHKQVRQQELCPSSKLADLWDDALIMDASEGSLKLIAEQIMRKEVSAARANYLFTMMAFARNPTPAAVRAVLPLMDDKDVPRQALIGISALVRNSSPAGQQTPESQSAVKSIVKYMGKNIKHPDRVISALKALQNIGQIGEAVAKVSQLASDASQKSGVRVAAIESMRGMAGHPDVRSKCLQIFQKTQESSEIRIAAYKTAIESNDRQTVRTIVQTIRKESNKQVGAFVTTHLKNLQESSSPRHDSVRQILEDEKIPVERFPQDLRKYSRNFEVSQYIERLGFGGVLDADLIYDKSFAPRSIRLNLTVPVFESEFNMFEFGFRQIGLEDEIKKLVGPHLKGRNAQELMAEVVSEVVDLFDQESNEVRTGRFNRNTKQRQSLFQKLNSKADVEASFYLNFDGKTIAYFDIADLSQPENDMTQAIRSLIQEIKQNDKTDRAYSVMFAKNEFQIPTKDGKKPVAINGTLIFGLKGDRNTFVPSVAIEMSTRTNDKRYEQRFSSSAAIGFNVEYRNERPVKLSLKMPKETQTLIHAHSAVYDIDSQGRESSPSPAYQKISKCTTGLTRAFGIEFCGKMSAPDDMLGNGIPPFNGLWEVELEARKTDRQMSGWEVSVELPAAGDDEHKYLIAFDTPDSRIQRRVALLVRAYDRFQGLQVKVESADKSWDASASYTASKNEIRAKSQLTTANREKYSLEAGVKREQKGQKQDWTPVLRITAPDMQPIALTGQLSISSGRKSQLSFELKSENSNRFVRGAFVKDGSLSMTTSFRMSSDVQADFGPMNFRIFSSAEQQANSMSADLKVDYQTEKSRKHSFKVTGKLHDLSTASYKKVNSFIETQTTQFPAMNHHVSWNFLMKPNEHLENELTVVWDRQMRDQKNKIHILQISKATGLTSGLTVTAENILSIEIAPIAFKYEVKGSGSMERSQNPHYKLQLEVNNKHKKEDDMLVSFEVRQTSAKPLKMSIDASYVSAARELHCSDRIEEVAPRVFKGRTQFQWQQDKKTTMGYTLKVKSDSRKTDLDIDAEIKTPSMRHGLRHQGLFRLASGAMDLQSKVFYEKSNIWDMESSLRSEGKSAMRITMKGFEGKAEAQLQQVTKSLIVEFKGNDYSHASNLLIANEAVTLSSKSMHDQRPVLVVNVRKNAKDATRVNIECPIFDSRMEVSGRKESPATAVFDFRGKTGQRLALKTKASFSLADGLELSGETKSDSFAPHSASLKVKQTGQGVSVSVHSDRESKEWIAGKALLEQAAQGLRATAQVSVSGSQIGRLQSQLHRQIVTGPHDLEVNFRPSPESKQQTLKFHHEIGNGEAKSVCTYLVDGQQKGQLENFCRFRASFPELEVAAGFTLKSEVGYHNLDRLHLSFEHKHRNERRNFQSESRLKYQMSESEKYEIAVTSSQSGDRKAGKASAMVALETPKYDFKRQSSQFSAQWTQETISLEHKTSAKDVSIAAETTVSRSDLTNGPHALRVSYAVPRSAPWSLQARHQIKDGNLDTSADYMVRGNRHSAVRAKGQLKRRNGQIDFAGPHDLELEFETPSTDAQSLRWHHEASNGQVKCKLTHAIRGEEKQWLENEARVQCPSSHNCQASATLTIRSLLNERLNGLQASVEHRHKIGRNSVQAETKVSGKKGDEKYQMNASLAGNGDGKQGKVSLKIAAESPIASFEQQISESECRWTMEKVTLEHKTRSSEVKMNLKTSVSRRQLLSGPHEAEIDVTGSGVSAYAAVASHEIANGNLKTNIETSVNGKTQLHLNANGNLRQSNSEIEGTLNAELNNERLAHTTTVQKSSGGLAFESKTKLQDQPFASANGRLFEKEASFLEIECPVFKLRADASDLTSPTTGSLSFDNKIARRESFQCRFSIESGKTIEVHAEGKSRTLPECTADLKVTMNTASCAVEYRLRKAGSEWSKGEGQANWQTGVRINGRVTRQTKDLALVDVNLAENMIVGPNEASIELLAPRSHQYALQMKHQIAAGTLRSSADVRFAGKEQLALTVEGQATRANGGLDMSLEAKAKSPSKTHQVKYEHFARQSRNEIEAKSTLTVQNQKYIQIHGLFSPNQKFANLESAQLNAKFQMTSGREQRLTAQVTGKRFSHSTEAVSKARVLNLDSKSYWDNEPIAIVAARIHDTDASFIKVQSAIADATIETDSLSGPNSAAASYTAKFGDQKEIRVRVSTMSQSKLQATAEWKSDRTSPQSAKLEASANQQSISGRLSLKQQEQEYASGQADISVRGKAIKAAVRLTQDRKDVLVAQAEANQNWIYGPHELKVEGKSPMYRPFTMEAKHKTENGNLKSAVDVRVNGEQQLAIEAAGKVRQSRDRFELNVEAAIKTPAMNHHIKYETSAHQTRNSIETKSKMALQKQPLFEVQSFYSPEKNVIKFENSQIKGKVEAVFGREARFTADFSGNRFTHFSQAVAKSNEWTLDSKTHWERKPIAVVKSRVHSSEKSFFDIESVIFDCRAETDSMKYPSAAAFNFASKVGDQKVLKCRVAVDGIKSLEISAEGKSASIAKCAVLLKVRNSQSAYEVEYQVQQNGKDYSSGEARILPRGQGLDAVAKVRQAGQEICRLEAHVSGQWIEGPHDVEVVLPRTRRSQPASYKIHHDIQNGKINSSVVQIVNGKEWLIGDVSGRGVLDAVAGVYMKA